MVEKALPSTQQSLRNRPTRSGRDVFALTSWASRSEGGRIPPTSPPSLSPPAAAYPRCSSSAVSTDNPEIHQQLWCHFSARQQQGASSSAASPSTSSAAILLTHNDQPNHDHLHLRAELCRIASRPPQPPLIAFLLRCLRGAPPPQVGIGGNGAAWMRVTSERAGQCPAIPCKSQPHEEACAPCLATHALTGVRSANYSAAAMVGAAHDAQRKELAR
ncbi:hypothetical protein BDY17DRAFT_136063 [Neohortaea acidophila]|uniref:Uncharacterized protein n=1 Tax=Neohortaea acidophila TaxID=245834 RepID=A0A6A6PZF5_9PEZI|nr:uncharacterized protein BDY17DRAFT_136063 [Neohortaea acidophila]KAF2484813.1 hypothetical protein BDY17DRAFT_136063 [Neohortaea acidophila]